MHQAAKTQIDGEVLVPQQSQKNTVVCKEMFKGDRWVYHTCVLCMHLCNREGGLMEVEVRQWRMRAAES